MGRRKEETEEEEESDAAALFLGVLMVSRGSCTRMFQSYQ